ncbi:MAG: tetratricopeptide repeat protein [Planctomycetota bacterium]
MNSAFRGLLVLLLGAVCGWAVVAHADRADFDFAAVFEGKTLDPATIEPDILAFLDELNDGLRRHDAQAVAALFDTDAWFAQVSHAYPEIDTDEPIWQTVRKQSANIFGQNLTVPQANMAWIRSEIKAIEPTHVENGFAVTMRHWDSDGIASKNIIDLVRTPDGLRFYDLTQLDLGVRWSDIFASGIAAGQMNRPGTQQSLLMAYGGVQALAEGNSQLALEQLEQVNLEVLPSALRPMILTSFCEAYYDLGDVEKALGHVTESLALYPEHPQPLAHYYRAACLVDLERPDEALVEAMRYADLVGVDADIWVVVADAYMLQDRFDMGLSSYAKALDDDPQHYEALLYYLFFLGDDQKHEFRPRYEAVENRTDIGALLAEDLDALDDPAGLAALCAMHRELHPGDTWPADYE